MQRYRDSTRANYYKIWKLFGRFYLRLDVKLTEWNDRILLFVAFLIENKLKSSSVKSYISAIKGVLAEDNIFIEEDSFLLSSLTRACKLKNDQVITRLPVYKQLFHLLLNQTKCHFESKGQNYLLILYTAMFTASYYGLLQAGEVTEGPHVILAENVHIGVNKDKILFILKSSKMHSKGNKPQQIKLTREKMDKCKPNKFCPFKILQNYISARPAAVSSSEQFFVFADRSPVKPNPMRLVFKTLLTAMNIDANLYNLHSFRIGRC